MAGTTQSIQLTITDLVPPKRFMEKFLFDGLRELFIVRTSIFGIWLDVTQLCGKSSGLRMKIA
jgi:hypothetical protein